MTADIVLQHRLGAFHLDANFQFSAPGVTALFGPSGAGKSTIIHAIAGLLRPQAGRVVIDGETLLDTAKGIFLPARARRIGVVFQDTRLFPHLTVKQNLLYGWHRSAEKSSAQDIGHVVSLLGLENFLERRPRTLSGGERSRVALGRALLMRPRALLLDEPLAALDAARKAEILPYLERLRDESRIPMLYVSHSLDEVARIADRMIVLDSGRVLAEGTLFDVTARLDLVTGKELFTGTILEAVIASHDTHYDLTQLSLGDQTLIVPHIARGVGEKVRVRIDAKDVMLAMSRPLAISANNVLQGVVSAIRASDGPHADVQMTIGAARLTARVTRRSLERLQLAPGGQIFAVIKSVTVGGREHSLT
jgi:molybdate transport system ATP-binding protein